ncbi:lariat debranching enzyme, C-terminal domain-containing protein [Blastocladiella britannica]|nr:lariat debranching enzyme, C-terminal domain-containing protein [Blastocladiella britannica]
MRIAVIGCGHGELDAIYASIRAADAHSPPETPPVDLVIVCGDFEAIRSPHDLPAMAVPPKFRVMADFHKYYALLATAPCLTIFIGGNHESSAYLWELYHGGWAAPNIFFMGWANVVKVGSLRIGGMSGIWNWHSYNRGHEEVAPYDQDQIRSVYHVRQHEVVQMALYPPYSPIDVFLSHDWPRNIVHHGDLPQLLRCKKFFEQDIGTGRLGSPPMEHLLTYLRPTYWFSGHLHVKFAALVDHHQVNRHDHQAAPNLFKFPPAQHGTLAHGRTPGASSSSSLSSTRFLALDKVIPGRRFLQILDLPDHTAGPLEYDLDWLAIVKATHADGFPRTAAAATAASRSGYVSGATSGQSSLMAKAATGDRAAWRTLRDRVAKARVELEHTLPTAASRAIPLAFAPTAPMHMPAANRPNGDDPMAALAARPHANPQTAAFAQMLGITDVTAGGVTWDDYLALANQVLGQGASDAVVSVAAPIDLNATGREPGAATLEDVDEGAIDLDNL